MVACGPTKKQSGFFNVKEMKGYTKNDLEKLIGDPDTTYAKRILSNKFDVLKYNDKETEFRFLNDTITAIIINKPFDLVFKPELISDYGFDFAPPHEQDTSSFYRWKNFQGIKNINIYKVGMKRPEGVDAYFKVYFDLN